MDEFDLYGKALLHVLEHDEEFRRLLPQDGLEFSAAAMEVALRSCELQRQGISPEEAAKVIGKEFIEFRKLDDARRRREHLETSKIPFISPVRSE